jgi:hypothetical protein
MFARSKFLRSVVILTLSMPLGAGLIPALAAEQAVAPERNPPGDIPDSQVFITYTAPGFSMQVPEGWSRNDVAGGAQFSDKYNLLEITSADATAAPTVESAKSGEAADLVAKGHAVAITGITAVNLDGGPAIRIEYQANSAPNDVTGKQIRLERVRYLYSKGNKLVRLDMAAPAGADNVDQWLLMANSVKLG